PVVLGGDGGGRPPSRARTRELRDRLRARVGRSVPDLVDRGARTGPDDHGVGRRSGGEGPPTCFEGAAGRSGAGDAGVSLRASGTEVAPAPRRLARPRLERGSLVPRRVQLRDRRRRVGAGRSREAGRGNPPLRWRSDRPESERDRAGRHRERASGGAPDSRLTPRGGDRRRSSALRLLVGLLLRLLFLALPLLFGLSAAALLGWLRLVRIRLDCGRRRLSGRRGLRRGLGTTAPSPAPLVVGVRVSLNRRRRGLLRWSGLRLRRLLRSGLRPGVGATAAVPSISGLVRRNRTSPVSLGSGSGRRGGGRRLGRIDPPGRRVAVDALVAAGRCAGRS